MNRVYTTTLRFNLDKPGDRMALQYLQDAGKEEYKSLNRAVIAAVNDHFLRKTCIAADPYLETREKEDAFLQRVRETLSKAYGLYLRQHQMHPLSPSLRTLRRTLTRRWISSTAFER